MRVFRFVLALVLLFFASADGSAQVWPNLWVTHGDILRAVPSHGAASCLSRLTGTNITAGDPITVDLICTPNYSNCVRSVSERTKRRIKLSYGEHYLSTYCSQGEGCQIDHLIPLALGGSNGDTNLWPQPYEGQPFTARQKDTLPRKLRPCFCTKSLSHVERQAMLERYQFAIRWDWTALYTDPARCP